MATRWALGIAFASSLAVAGCGPAPNRLYGSVSTVYALDFATTKLSLIGSFIVVEYLKAGATGGKTVKLSVDETGLAIVPLQKIDLTQMVGGGTRGTLERIVDGTMELPMLRGTLAFDEVPVVGAHLAGHFYATLAMPAGFELDGDFDGTLAMP